MGEPTFALLVGLGNPGPEYEKTRHNVGFMVLEAYARQLGLQWERSRKPRGVVARAEGSWLLKPMTYMNLSGEAVGGWARYHRITPDRVLVVYDDLDLPLGRLRLRDGGGTGGHRGIASVCSHLGTNAIARLRFGVGRPEGAMPVEHFVLEKFSEVEWETVLPSIGRACDAIACAQNSGLEVAKNRFNPDVT